MKKCIFIIPYFGKFPNYFELFLKSCEYNPSFNWLFISDCVYEGKLPSNVCIKKMSFKELQKKFQNKFDFKISLNTPYKLCDYKPSYGYVFEEEIKDFKYWGHCDIDTLMGDLAKFLKDDFLENYDKIFCLGHMIIYKNNYENNRVFMSAVNGQEWYKDVFQTDKIKIFDETYKNSTNVNTIFKYLNKNIFQEDWSINFKVLPTHFVKTTYNHNTNKFDNDDTKALYTWENGHIYRYSMKEKQMLQDT